MCKKTENGKSIWPIVILVVGFILILAAPFLLTMPFFCERFNFSITGQVGDTIGGTTAPIVNLLAAILVYYALMEQIKANRIIQDQVRDAKKEKEADDETANLLKYYEHLDNQINSFSFDCLEALKHLPQFVGKENVTGAKAFYRLFGQIRCEPHSLNENSLLDDPSISELFSILTIMNTVLLEIKDSKAKNAKIIKELIKHQFEYKIVTRIRDDEATTLGVYYCENCKCNHGIPTKIAGLIIDIRENLK